MSDTTNSESTSADAQAAQPQAPKPTPPAAQHVADQSTDWEAEAKKWEKRSKDNFAEAQKVPTLTQQLSELESKLNETQHEANESVVAAFREAAVMFAGVSEEDAQTFLTGNDKDALAKQAARLKEMLAQSQPTPGHVPGEGRSPEVHALNSDGLEQSLKSALGIV